MILSAVTIRFRTASDPDWNPEVQWIDPLTKVSSFGSARCSPSATATQNHYKDGPDSESTTTQLRDPVPTKTTESIETTAEVTVSDDSS